MLNQIIQNLGKTFNTIFINKQQQNRQNLIAFSRNKAMRKPQIQPTRSTEKQNKAKAKEKQQILKQLRILDYRNGKYQGFTSHGALIRNGLGILIDDNYSFILTQWKDNKVQGPFFMLYPDESILYGYVQKQKMGEIICYEVNKQFSMILSKNSSTLVVDLLPSSSILVFKIDKKFIDEHSIKTILQMKQKDKQQSINSSISLVNEEHYGSIEEKYKIYQKTLSISSIPDYLKNYELFIKKNFNDTPQKLELIQLVKTKEDLTINFKKSSTTLFLKLFLQSNQTKMLGSMNRHQNKYQFYKKVLHNTNSIEQSVIKSKSSFITQYNLSPNIRPKKCIIQLLNFHKGSTTYFNQFVELKYMYSIQQNMLKINQLVNYYATTNFAQVQLQNSRYQMNQQVKKSQAPHIKYTLSQVQQQIYDAVKRKQQSSGKKLYSARTPTKIESQYHINKSTQIQQKSLNKTSQIFPKNMPYTIKPLLNEDNLFQSRLNRSKTYLNISNISRNNQMSTSAKKNTSQVKNENQKKYNYLDDIQNQVFLPSKRTKSPFDYNGYQNIRKLTQDYEKINKQIKISTPKGKKSRSPYRLDNGVYQESSRKSHLITQYNKQTGVKYPISSQKKVFRYLPN